VPVLRYRRHRQDPFLGSLAATKPDLVCVASFPSLLEPSVLRLPRLGSLGIHHSLLPRHRGPDPIFWTYFCDDSETGVTVFWLDDGEDTGDVLAQEVVPLARGQHGVELYHELSRRGSALLLRALEDVRDGRAARAPQAPEGATREPAPASRTWRVDFETWGSERLWHFLRGVGAAGGILADSRGRPLAHGAARRFVLGSAEGTPGGVQRTRDGWRLTCRDGFVDLDPPSLRRQAAWAARRLLGSARS
jgi:methionyl-tRNA formyltransferase